MANLSKIKVGGTSYDIMPQLGTALKNESGTLGLEIGNGIAFDKESKLAINIGSGLSFDTTEGKVFISLGSAVVKNSAETNTGISIIEGGFQIDSDIFKNYLQSLGVVFN